MANLNLPHNHSQDVNELLSKMPSTEHFTEAAETMSQLCDTTRLRILWLLCHCEECGVNIAAAVGMSTAAVAHHLKLLKMHGIIKSRRDGKEVYYTLADNQTARLVHKMIDDFFQMSCPDKGV